MGHSSEDIGTELRLCFIAQFRLRSWTLREAVTQPFRAIACDALSAAFPHGILDVVHVRTEKQVSGVDAGGHIALVQKMHTGGDASDVQLVAHTGCAMSALVDPQLPIPMSILSGIPEPAACFSDRLPLFVESLSKHCFTFSAAALIVFFQSPCH